MEIHIRLLLFDFLAYQPSEVIKGQSHHCKRTVLLFKPELMRDQGVYIFLNSIDPKVYVRARLQFELAYFELVVQQYIHYATENASLNVSSEE